MRGSGLDFALQHLPLPLGGGVNSGRLVARRERGLEHGAQLGVRAGGWVKVLD